MPGAWIGDWHKRITEKVSSLGHQTITSFIDSHPRSSLVELAEILGENVAAEQLLRLYRAEARSDSRAYATFARSTLARRLISLVSAGWRLESSGDAHAYGAWSTDVGEEHDAAIERVYAALDDLAPRGWIPSGPDDPILLKGFESW